MKNIRVLAILGLVLAVTGSALAVSGIPPYPLTDPGFTGWVRIKYVSWSSGRSYTPTEPVPAPPVSGRTVFQTVLGEANVDALGQTSPAVLWDNDPNMQGFHEDSVTIFMMEAIRIDGGTNQYLWNDFSDPNREIIGVFYGLRDQAIQFEIDNAGNIHQKIQGTGGIIKLYAQEKGTFDPSNTTRTAIDQFTGVGDTAGAILLAEMVVTDWAGGQPVSLAEPGGYWSDFVQTDAVTGAGSGHSEFYSDGYAGTLHDGMIGNGEYELPNPLMWTLHGLPFSEDGDYYTQVDVRPNTEAIGPVAGDGDDAGIQEPWILLNDDPVLAYSIVPEPMTIAGVFMAIGGIGAYIRKRKATA